MYTSSELRAPIEGKSLLIQLADGTSLSTVSVGRGSQDIILAHGYGVTHLEWNIISRMINLDKYRLIAFDQRGHGKSTIGSDGIHSAAMASDYKAVLEAYDVQNGVLGGHSMGGFLAQKFLLEYPQIAKERIKGCLLIATFAGDINRKNFQNRLQIPLIQSGVLQALIRNKALGRAFTKTLIGPQWDEAMSKVFLETFLAQNHQKLVPIMSAFQKENYYEQIKSISIPCTIIVGLEDKTTPDFHTEDMYANIPNSTMVKVPRSGHLINWEAPEALLAELEKLAAA